MNIYNILQRIKETGETGLELMRDSFIIGVEVGRQKLTNIENIISLVKELYQVKLLIDSNQKSHFLKDQIYNSFISSPNLLLKETILYYTQGKNNTKCPICYKIIEEKDMFTTYTCNHQMHKICFLNQAANILRTSQEVQCPGCSKLLDKHDIHYAKTAQIDPELYSECPTIGCNFKFIIEKGQRIFNCQQCYKSYCIHCKSECLDKYHQCSNSDQEQMEVGENYKQCPKCSTLVLKNEEHNIQYCDSCKCQFCCNCGKGKWKCKCRYLITKIYSKVKQHISE